MSIHMFALIRDNNNRVLTWDGANNMACNADKLTEGDVIDYHDVNRLHGAQAGTVVELKSKPTSKARRGMGDVSHYLEVGIDNGSTFMLSPTREIVLVKPTLSDAYVLGGYRSGDGVAILEMPDQLDEYGAYDAKGNPVAMYDEMALMDVAETGLTWTEENGETIMECALFDRSKTAASTHAMVSGQSAYMDKTGDVGSAVQGALRATDEMLEDEPFMSLARTYEPLPAQPALVEAKPSSTNARKVA